MQDETDKENDSVLLFLWPSLYGIREILVTAEHPWVLQPVFERRYQQPGESIKDFQQALRLLAWMALPKMNAKALNTRVLEQLVTGVCYRQIRKALLRDRPSTLENSLALSREEEVLQAACEQPPRSLFGVTASSPSFLTTQPFKRLGSPATAAPLPGE
ncbi:unnamed protein product [Schistocephalus solidus]|uniref:Transposase n=1 Tax=Schistocephalus solidus TaxID=70667 RepID=A0A183S8S3_SCHSO|nr:unnamed protein product [Schistocephalus solidus]